MSTIHIFYNNYYDPINGYNDFLYDNEDNSLCYIKTDLPQKANLTDFIDVLNNNYNNNYDVLACLHKHNNKSNQRYVKHYRQMISSHEFTNITTNATIKNGDIIDVEGYRGNGFYYVYEHEGILKTEKTLGEYGQYLPFEGIKMIDNFVGIDGVHLPKDTKIICQNKKIIIDDDTTYLDIIDGDGERNKYLVNDIEIDGFLIRND